MKRAGSTSSQRRCAAHFAMILGIRNQRVAQQRDEADEVHWAFGTETSMAINIVFDHPGHQTGRRLAHLVASLVGALLVAIGLLATVVAIPAGFVTLGDLIGRWQHEQVYSPDFPV